MNKQIQHLTLFSGTLIASLGALQAAEKEAKPNFILINIDDLGWSDLGYNGSAYYETPNIDKLYGMGVNFNMGYASAANSAPSRASLLTGVYTPRHGVFTVNSSTQGKDEHRGLIVKDGNALVPEGMTTLPMALRDGGYTTCHIGKWHIGDDPTKQGIDLNIGGNHTGSPKGGHFGGHNNPNLKDGVKGECLTTRLGKEAVNYIKSSSEDKPFFLYYAPYAVHTPIQADPKITAKYASKEATEAHDNPKYAAMIEVMDNTVGMILDAVEEKDIAENTVIIFTSDNGGVYKISRQWPLRAGKGSFYEGGIREPFIVYQKGQIDGGKEYDVSVGQVDIFPTFMDMANISYDKELDGLSLKPLLLKGKTKEIEKRALFWHFPAYLAGGHSESTDKVFRTRPVSVVRFKDWKLIENYDYKFIGAEKLELYNIANDPSEKTNLAKENAEMTETLYKMLNGWKQEVNAPIPQPK